MGRRLALSRGRARCWPAAGRMTQAVPSGRRPPRGRRRLPRPRVEHKYGTTTVPSKPERIVAVGLTEHDTMLALGEKPIATSEWYGEQPYAVLAVGARRARRRQADGAQTRGRLRVREDRRTSARPDPGRELGHDEGGLREALASSPRRSRPARAATDWFSNWDPQVELIAAALGKPRRAVRSSETVKDDYAKVGGRAPGVQGQDGHVRPERLLQRAHLRLPGRPGHGLPDDARLQDQPEAHAAGQEPRRAGRDLRRAARRPRRRHDRVRDGGARRHRRAARRCPRSTSSTRFAGKRAVYTDGTLAGAMYFMTPLSLDYVLEHLHPAARGGGRRRAPQRMVDAS